MTYRLPLFTLVLGLFLAACGDGSTTNEPTTVQEPDDTEAPATTPAPADEPAVAYDGPAFEMTITPVGNQMLFEQTEFEVQPGQTVRITFENTATTPAMTHNVVFVRSQEDIEPVGQAALTAADTEYIPASEENRILAYTPLAEPGETVTVEFTAPSTPGDYPYICTFPGHYMMMQGTMTVAS